MNGAFVRSSGATSRELQIVPFSSLRGFNEAPLLFSFFCLTIHDDEEGKDKQGQERSPSRRKQDKKKRDPAQSGLSSSSPLNFLARVLSLSLERQQQISFLVLDLVTQGSAGRQEANNGNEDKGEQKK